MQTLTLLVGLPASGKSTYTQQYIAQDGIMVLSSDAIRGELFNDETNQDNNSLVFKTLYSRAREALIRGDNVIIDATNINIRDRKRVLDNFTDLNIRREAIIFDTPTFICIERDKNRSRTVGKKVIFNMKSRYQRPTKQEGFDKITIIRFKK